MPLAGFGSAANIHHPACGPLAANRPIPARTSKGPLTMMPTPRVGFRTILELLLGEGFDRLKFVSLAKEHPDAEQFLVSNVVRVDDPVKRKTMLTALWYLMGAERFTQYYSATVSRFWALEFLYDRVQEHSTEFSDTALAMMKDRADPLGEFARKLLRRRLEAA
jgi:hypothetical protein